MVAGQHRWLDPRIDVGRGVLDTHVHLPPNFSSFRNVEEAVELASAEHVAVLGASNFHDLSVYSRLATAAARHGILALHGFEIIAVMDEPAHAGMRVNDPENAGRAYLCGKGIAAPWEPSPEAARRLAAARASNGARTRLMVDLLRERFVGAGLSLELTYDGIVDEVATRADVPSEWVVLQERHVAEATQAAIFEREASDRRVAFLERAYGASPSAPPDDAVAVQREIRSRLVKAGGAAFVPETPVSFSEAVDLILELGAIPCYPVLADGTDPVCQWEDPPAELARRLADRGIVVAELIPVRNDSRVVDEYVTALRDAGIIVMAGTEHNTWDRIPFEPRCRDGSRTSPAAREAFAEATCVAVAHQHLREQGASGFVDRQGRPSAGFADGEARIRWFRELGAGLIADQAAMPVA